MVPRSYSESTIPWRMNLLGPSERTVPRAFPPEVEKLSNSMLSFKQWLRQELEAWPVLAFLIKILQGYGTITLKIHHGHLADIDVQIQDHVPDPSRNVIADRSPGRGKN